MTTWFPGWARRRAAAVAGAVVVLAGVDGLAGIGGLAGVGAAGGAPIAHPAVISAERAVAGVSPYWTRARMVAAQAVTGAGGAVRASLVTGVPRVIWAPRVTGMPRVTGVPWGGGGAVARTTGKVFFTLDGTDYVCSGSVVASANQDVVLTAAHCVGDGAGHWASHWTFVPGYADGRAPYGSYPARAFFVPAQWTDDAAEADDIAFVAVGTARLDGARRHVAAVVGGQRIGFGRRGGTEAVFGYPQQPPYHGRVLEYCDGPLRPDPYGLADAGLACGLTQGGSGGPWLSSFDPATGQGVISGVTAFRYAGDNVTLYSPDLGQVAQALYQRASRA